MNFNGKNLIFIGSILFFMQLINFVSINQINPEIERAQVLAAISSIIIMLIGFWNKKPINIIIIEDIAANTWALSISGFIWLIETKFINCREKRIDPMNIRFLPLKLIKLIN